MEDMFMFHFVSFSFKAKENLQRCGDAFFDILIKGTVTSALGMFLIHFKTLTGV